MQMGAVAKISEFVLADLRFGQRPPPGSILCARYYRTADSVCLVSSTACKRMMRLVPTK